MSEQVLDGHLRTPVTIDICFTCHAFWFDERESLQLTPASTLKLFRQIGEAARPDRRQVGESLKCPRCALRLKPVQDMQRTTRFHYQRCPQNHGRFITFFDFLREKNFLKPMSPAQIEELRRNIGAVNCSNCGASVDLAKGTACAHCGSPLCILDATQAEQLVTQLRSADKTNQPVDPALPMRLAQARREVASSFDAWADQPDWFADASRTGLVEAGLHSLARWLKTRA